jgi:hypothetical protein
MNAARRARDHADSESQTTRKPRAARSRTTRAHEAARNRLLRFNPAQQLRHLAMLMQDRRIGLQ